MVGVLRCCEEVSKIEGSGAVGVGGGSNSTAIRKEKVIITITKT